MKKIIILMLAISTFAYGQESAITATGRRVILNEDFTWSFIEENTSEGFDFRKTHWGMNMEEVALSETLEKVESGSDDILMYNAKVSDYWKNDLYKDDYSKWGFAVSYGHYVKYASWETDKTEVDISLSGENFSVRHSIDYTSIELKDLQESTASNNAIEDL